MNKEEESSVRQRDHVFTVEEWPDDWEQLFVGPSVIFEGWKKDEPKLRTCPENPETRKGYKGSYKPVWSNDKRCGKTFLIHPETCECSGKGYFNE